MNDVLPLAPLQEGPLFLAVSTDEASGVYVVQFPWTWSVSSTRPRRLVADLRRALRLLVDHPEWTVAEVRSAPSVDRAAPRASTPA
jgi:hypothetical protein